MCRYTLCTLCTLINITTMYNGSNVFIPNHAFSTYTVSMLVANSERKIVFPPLNSLDNIV